MSEPQVIVSSLNQDPEDSNGIGGWSWLDRLSQQIRLLAPSTVSSVSVKMWREGEPIGDLSMKIYACEGTFRSIDSKPTGDPIASSTNTLNVAELGTDWPGEAYDFTFNDVELAAGLYYISIEADDVTGDGSVSVLECGDWEQWLVPNLGAVAFYNSENGWMSMHQYD
jgi:hypothetical protein